MLIPALQLENEKFIPKLVADPRFVGKNESYAQAVSVGDFVDDDQQVQEGGNQYYRVVYLKLAERLAPS
jgi:hypothetical protein